MSTVKNADARRLETRAERRDRLADPALEGLHAEVAELQNGNLVLQQNKKQTALDLADNLQRILAGAIAVVKIATPDRDASVNGRFRYDRNYERMLAAAKQVVLQTGKRVELPAYLPAPAISELTTTVGPSDFPQNSSYHEHGSPPTGITPNRPDGSENESWLNLQGARK